MPKNRSKLFLVSSLMLLLSTPALNIQLGKSKPYFAHMRDSSTEVGGFISENTTWTIEGSPYIVVSDVIVGADVYLTIDSGVTVKFTATTSLIVDGSLIAVGNTTHKIALTSNATAPAKGDWEAVNIRTGGSCKRVMWVTVEYSTSGIKDLSNSNVTQSVFHRNDVGVSGSNINIEESNFTRNDAGVSGSNINIEESNFTRNDVGVSGSNINITLSTFEGNSNGVAITNAAISNSEFDNNTNGISLDGRRNEILRCQVSQNNATGISLEGAHETPQACIENTNISHNGEAGISSSTPQLTVIRNCTISNNKGSGVSANKIYDSVVCNNSGFGAFLSGGHAIMSHSNVSNNLGGGVIARPDTAHWPETYWCPIEYSEISGNLFGIEVSLWCYDPTFLNVSHTHIFNNSKGGIIVSPYWWPRFGGGSLLVFDSIIDSNGRFGIRMNTTTVNEGNQTVGESILPVPKMVNSSISNHSIGALGKFGVISGSEITNSQVGLKVYDAAAMYFNNIHDNGMGLDIFGISANNWIGMNNICDNEIYNVRNRVQFGKDVNASHNWWGTTNETLIEDSIYDYYDNYTLGRVIYKPYLTQPFEPAHDIAVTDVVPSENVVVQGESLDVDVTVENQGFFTETSTVMAYVNSTDSGDDFNDNSTDWGMWKTLEKDGGVVSEANGRVECSVLLVPPGGDTGYITRASYDLSDCEIQVDVSNHYLQELNLAITLEGIDDHFWYSENFYVILKQKWTETCKVRRRIDGGSRITLYDGNWTGPVGSLRIRIRNGTIYFYEEENLRYSEQFALSSYRCYIHLQGHTLSKEFVGMDCFDNFSFVNNKAIGMTEVTLSRGDSTTISYPWNTTDYMKGNYTMSAYAWPVPSENDTADNLYVDGIVQIISPKETHISFSLSPNTVNPEETVILLGNLTESIGGRPINNSRVDVYVNGTLEASLHTNGSGWFTASGQVGSAGTFNVTVEYSGSLQYLPSSDWEILVVNKLQTGIYAVFIPNPVSSGENCALKGILVNQYGNPIRSEKLTLKYSTDYGSTWNLAGILTTNSYGMFSQAFIAPSPSTYLVKISYDGSRRYQSSSVTIALIVY